ncbi:MAG: hypothetical protein IT542_08815 [Rubellimicrobium sp.]|nr:hypothetical protein [Rubellimicrobium sp.]
MWSLRRLVAFMLVLTLALTSQELARARGQGVADGSMVICAGGGLVMVSVGPDGMPVGPAHVCPDAVLAVATPPLAPVVAGAPSGISLFVPSPVIPVLVSVPALPVPQARAPPALA